MFHCTNDTRLPLTGLHNNTPLKRDGGPRYAIGLFIKAILKYNLGREFGAFIPDIFESGFIEITNTYGKSVQYRPKRWTHTDPDIFSRTIQHIMHIIQHNNKPWVFMGDMNIISIEIRLGNHTTTSDYLDAFISHYYLPIITTSTRLSHSLDTLID